MTPKRSSASGAVTASAIPHRGRRLSWREFYAERPDLQPANDNAPAGQTMREGDLFVKGGLPSLGKIPA